MMYKVACLPGTYKEGVLRLQKSYTDDTDWFATGMVLLC